MGTRWGGKKKKMKERITSPPSPSFFFLLWICCGPLPALSLFHVKLSCLSSVYNYISFFFSPLFVVSLYLTTFQLFAPHLYLVAVCSKQMLLLMVGATAAEMSTCSFNISKDRGLCFLHPPRCVWQDVEPKWFLVQSNFQSFRDERAKKKKKKRFLTILWTKSDQNALRSKVNSC